MQKFLIYLLTVALGVVVYGSYQLLYGIDNQFVIWRLKIELEPIQIKLLPITITVATLVFSYLFYPKVVKIIRFLMDLIFLFSLFALVFQFFNWALNSILNGRNIPTIIAIALSAIVAISTTLFFGDFLEARTKKLKQQKLKGKKKKFSVEKFKAVTVCIVLTVLVVGNYYSFSYFQKKDTTLLIALGTILFAVVTSRACVAFQKFLNEKVQNMNQLSEITFLLAAASYTIISKSLINFLTHDWGLWVLCSVIGIVIAFAELMIPYFAEGNN